MAAKKDREETEEKKDKKKKRISGSSIEGWDNMNGMERSRALALVNSAGIEGKVIPASDFDCGLHFLEVPDLCFQWALGRPGYAMGRIMCLMGYEGSSKTSKQFWLANLAMAQGGLAAAVFVEHADSTYHMQQYILPEYMPYFMCYPCDTLEEAIKKTYEIQEDFAEIDPEGKLLKVQIFDSIAGATQEKLLDEDNEPGAPKPGGIGAIMSDFVNAMQTRIARTNTLWAVNNQAKDAIEIGFKSSLPVSEIDKMVGKGGRALPFHATYHEIVKKKGALRTKSDVTKSGKVVEGFESQLTFKKNKLGVPRREVLYDVIWGKGFVFQDYTLDFLSSGRICGLTDRPGGSKGTLYYSKDLGISKEGALSADEIYQAIHSPELIGMFQKELEIVTEVPAPSGRGVVPVFDTSGGLETPPALPSES